MLNNYLFAAEHAADDELLARSGALPCEREGEWPFPDAGLLVRSTRAYFAVVGLSKGGVVKVWQRRPSRLVLSDCGFWGELAGGSFASSQWLERGSAPAGGPAAGALSTPLRVSRSFAGVGRRTLTPWLLIGFRLFSLTLGRSASASAWMKRRLVKVLVRRKRPAPLRLEREVWLEERSVRLRDTITVAPGTRLVRLERGAKFSTIHMGSSRYFQRSELAVSPPAVADIASTLTRDWRLTIESGWAAARAGEGSEAMPEEGAR
jgi:hypothetical protein